MGRKRNELNQNFGNADKLLRLSRETRNPMESIRFMALRMLMLGSTREQVMDLFDVKWTTLQKWVKLWNKGGAKSLRIGKPTGRPSIITDAVKECIVEIVEFTHPKTGNNAIGRFISGQLKKMGINLSKSAVYNFLKKADYRRIRPRKFPIKRNESAVNEFKLDYWAFYSFCEVWFFDETGIEGDLCPRYVWAKKGSKPKWYYMGNHIRENVLGAVNPKTGELECLIMPYTDTEVFQHFLNYFKKRTNNRHLFMIMDNASWHKVKSLDWGNITPVYLPPYSPDLNPIETLWKVIKDKLCDPIPPKTHDELQSRIMTILKELFNDKKQVKSICKVVYKVS